MKMTASFPFQLSLGKVTQTLPVISEGISIFFVLSGSLIVQTAEKKQRLATDDLMVMNPLQQYQLESTEKNLFLHLRIPNQALVAEEIGSWFPFIECSTIEYFEGKENKFQELREALVHLMTAYFKQDSRNTWEIYQYFFAILAILTQSFAKSSMPLQKNLVKETDSWMTIIIQQLHQQYDQPLTLKTLAEEQGISYSYLSRSFKKEVGLTFTEYMTQIRLFHATETLLLTKNSITKIALDNGFASVKNFHQVFKKQFAMTPTAYRKKNALTQQTTKQAQTDCSIENYQEIEGAQALQELARYIAEKDIEDANATVQETLTLSLQQHPTTAYHPSKKIIKIGPAKEGLSSGVKRELSILQQELWFDLVQFEGFCEETNFEKEELTISEYILNNQWFDFLVEIQLKPMIQFSLPQTYQTREAAQLWCDKQLKIIRHFLNRYGRQEVAHWYFQWSKTHDTIGWSEENRWAYHYFYKKLRQLLPSAKIGLFALGSLNEAEYHAYFTFISEQQTHNCLPDFISFHADPYASSEIKHTQAVRFKNYQKELFNRVNKVIFDTKNKMAADWNPELFLTDWNTLVGEGNTFSGTFFRSALILESILELSTNVDGLAYWLNIKIKERQTRVREDSSLSIFLYEELRRPLFFSLRFLTHLHGNLIAQNPGHILTQSQDQFQLLIYNSSYLDPSYSVDTFQVHYQTKKMAIHLTGIPTGEYLIREYVLDKDHGGIYNDWIKVGSQVEIDFELQKYLEQKILPKFELTKVFISSDGYIVNSTLTLNACKLYLFQPLY